MLRDRLVESLYTQSLLLAEDVRDYFDEAGRVERASLAPLERVRLSCESLKITTRLMQIMGWLLTQRLVQAGKLDEVNVSKSQRRLGIGPLTEQQTFSSMPVRARYLITMSITLHQQVERLGVDQEDVAEQEPARNLYQKLLTGMTA